MTAVPKNPRVSELRELLRHLNAFRAIFEDHGVEDITSPDGNVWSIWDLEYLFSQLNRLTLRQQQAITLCLVHGMRERDAAIQMGVSPTNPVAMYATLGLQRLLDMIDAGELERYHRRRPGPEQLELDRRRLIEKIEADVVRTASGCWIFPNPGKGVPRLLLRSPRHVTGMAVVFPVRLLYEARIGPIPPGADLAHTTRVPPFSISCISPFHAEPTFPTQKAVS